MSKIKMRTTKRTIKTRDDKKSVERAFRKKNIKALAKSVEPVQSKRESQEAQAAEEITEVAVSTVQRTAVAPKTILRRGKQKQQAKASSQNYVNKSAKVAAGGTAEETAVPPVFAQTSQKDHPEIQVHQYNTTVPQHKTPVNHRQQPMVQATRQTRATTPQPALPIRSESHVTQAKTTVPITDSIKTESVARKVDIKPKAAIRTAAVSNSPKQPIQAIRQRTTAVSRVQRAESQASRAVRANHTAQAAKTAKAAQTAKNVQAAKAAQTAKTARTTQQASQQIAAALKAVAEQLAAAVGSSLASISGVAALLAPLLVVVLIGVLLASPLGLFFSAEVEGKMTLQQAMSQLNTEFSDRIAEIESSVAHDEIQQNGQRAVRKEILTIYAVKTTTEPENPLDAVTMDEAHFAVLQGIFWDMNTIDYTTEIYTEEVTVEVEDSSGEVSEETQTVEKTQLVITISSKTAQEMAEEYGFNKEQLGYVTELLSEEYAEFWTILSVSGVGSNGIVAVALSQVGNVGGEPYWSWYGFSSRVSWCACFVSWCGDQCGYIDAGIIPKFSYCDAGIDWFKSRGQWQGRNYVPAPGDIIFFDPDDNGSANHVGIVESCDGTYIYTIEGNANDAVKQLCYSVGNGSIMGYGIWYGLHK